MAAKIIDGKALAQDIRAEIANGVEELKKSKGVVPGLGVILVGDDPASHTYVRMKGKACEKATIYSEQHNMPATATQDEIIAQVEKLNQDPKINGILVQLPLPDGIDEKEVLWKIDPTKDVDGLHPISIGALVENAPGFVPCTPHGVIKMIESTGTEIKGKDAVIIGRSNIVGKPTALMLMHRHATITVCHSRTKDLNEKISRADIVVAAVGKAHMIKGDWIKPGAVVIDVGTNRLEDGSLTGDVEFEAAKERAGFISPVPGGVGPMTITMLLYNTLESAKKAAGV